MDETELPEFLVDTVASIRLRRRAGEWDVVTGTPSGVRTGEAALQAFLLAFPWASVSSAERRGEGVEADLDLTLAWQAPDGAIGRSRVPGAGHYVFDPSGPVATFTLWPNLFTDEIYVYRAVGKEFDRRPARFENAAALNREALHRALKAWESLSGGVMAGVESELVEGIESHGFAADARAA